MGGDRVWGESSLGLYERDRELATGLAALEDAAAGRGSAVLVEGPAGIGKSALLREIYASASALGFRVLVAEGTDVERDFPFGIARQLVERLDDPAVGTAGVLGLGPSDGPVRAERDLPTVLHGLYWLVSDLAAIQPVVLAVDDLQWADDPSLQFVSYLAHRLSDLGVVLLLAARNDEPRATAVDDAIGRVMDAGALVVRPQPLTSAGVGQLVGHGPAELAGGGFATACHRATGGNPLLVLEVLRELAAAGVEPGDGAIGHLAGVAPEAVSRSVLRRLRAAGDDARRLAAALAVIGRQAELRDVAAVAGVDLTPAGEAGDRLVAHGVLAPGRALEYVHPLLRQAVLITLGPGEAAALHARAARQLAAVGQPATRVGAHLLASRPEAVDWAVTALRNAAHEALADGSPDAAVAFLRRARDEPPPGPDRVDVLVELGFAQARAGHLDCTATLAEALAAGAGPRPRGQIALELARTLWYLLGDAGHAIEVLDAVDADELPEDLALRIASQRLELCLGWTDGLGGLGPDAWAEARPRLEELRPRAHPPRPESAVLLGTLARTALETGASLEEAGRLALEAGAAGEESLLYSSLPDVLVWTERYDEAAHLLDGAVEEGRRRGSPYLFGVASLWRGVQRHRRGQLADAEADCRACVEVMDGLGVTGLTFPRAFLADVLLERDIEAAAEVLVAAIPPAGDGRVSEFLLTVRAKLAALRGDLDGATVDLRAAGETVPHVQSPAILPWRSELALVLHARGERAEAVRLAEQELDLATAQGGQRAVGAALRAVGVVTGGDEGIAHLERAVAVLADSPAVLEQARALTALGAALRRARRPSDGREHLRQALDLAVRCGGTVLAARAREELLAAGGKPRRSAVSGVDALTASERRVAQLARQGLSNRQIAQALFVSMWTVATHLTSAYRKLGIEGRGELQAIDGLSS